MLEKIFQCKGVIMFYLLIVISIWGLNARFEALNKDQDRKEIVFNETFTVNNNE